MGAEGGGSRVPVAAFWLLAAASMGTSTTHQAPAQAARAESPLPAPLHPHAGGVGGVPGPGCLRTPQPEHGVPVPLWRGPSCHGAMFCLLAPCQSSATAAQSFVPCRRRNRILSGPGCRFLPLLPAKITWGCRGLGQWKNTAPRGEAASSPAGSLNQPGQRQQPSQLHMPPGQSQRSEGQGRMSQGWQGCSSLEPRGQ